MKEKRLRAHQIKRRHHSKKKKNVDEMKSKEIYADAEHEKEDAEEIEVKVTLCSGSSSSESIPASPSISSLASGGSSSTHSNAGKVPYRAPSKQEQHKIILDEIPSQILSADVAKKPNRPLKDTNAHPICSIRPQADHNQPLFKCNCCSNVFQLSCMNLPRNCHLYRFLQQYQKCHHKQHFQRIVDITNIHPSQQPYICPNCDIQGSSQYLMEYLEPFHTKRPPQKTETLKCSEIQLSRISQILQLYSLEIEASHIQTNTDEHCKDLTNRPKLQKRLFHKSIYVPDVIQENNSSKRHSVSSTSSSNLFDSNHANDQLQYKAIPSVLVGQPIQMYCPIDNIYHLGRIIDWRIKGENDHEQKFTKTSQNDQVELMKYEFLARFRSGSDGRNVALHQWIRLEDHAIMVGISLIWIRLLQVIENDEDNDDDNLNTTVSEGIKKNETEKDSPKIKPAAKVKETWRPAQIMLRSGLEMSVIENQMKSEQTNQLKNRENTRTNKLFAFAFFIGKEEKNAPRHAMINLMSSNMIRFHPPTEASKYLFCKTSVQNNNLHQTISTDLSFHNDQSLAFSISMACVENEEQILNRQSLNLPINTQDYFKNGLDGPFFKNNKNKCKPAQSPKVPLQSYNTAATSSSLPSLVSDSNSFAENERNIGLKKRIQATISKTKRVDERVGIEEIQEDEDNSMFETESEEDSSYDGTQ